ncbi:MAG TPA: UDP-N-acetylmuramoyl-L-alanyl-D-glutamate--2,6-diaminopimelate ligase [Dehalococcoidia bacterium]|nr:UDP-N-acetylmuramoyl-L-alanyl-D-glutamate--2,6-diaminopimelate ligase [Dehalococcoidia bacterium]
MTTRTSSELPTWFRDLSYAHVVSGTPGEASAVCHDSRRVDAGAVYVAIPGLTLDGNSFIPDAIARGARFVVVQEDLRERWGRYVNEDVSFVAVPDSRVGLAEAAAGFHGHPARSMAMIGVTGTDGKTTTTHLTAHVLNETGRRAGYLSSVEFAAGGVAEMNASHMTTVEATDIQRHLAKIRDAGGHAAVVEASSIGLDMHRVDMCEFDVGVFTNLAPDHLDYHGSMAEYRDAKAILFRMLGTSAEKGFGKAAVLNADDAAWADFRRVTIVPVISYGIEQEAELMAREIRPAGFGTGFKVRMFGETVEVETGLMGAYNVSNCLAAIGAAVSQGVEFESAVLSLASFPGVPGRMEQIDEGQDFRVVVDIASTEQAMRNVLAMLKVATKGRLIVVFGAAGERDPARRRGLARAVADAADHAVITNEDPRGEDPDHILDEIAGALKSAGFRKFDRELDRRQAIEMAFNYAERDDTVLLAGKGTEQSIVISGTHWPWDERRIARELLREARGVY